MWEHLDSDSVPLTVGEKDVCGGWASCGGTARDSQQPAYPLSTKVQEKVLHDPYTHKRETSVSRKEHNIFISYIYFFFFQIDMKAMNHPADFKAKFELNT